MLQVEKGLFIFHEATLLLCRGPQNLDDHPELIVLVIRGVASVGLLRSSDGRERVAALPGEQRLAVLEVRYIRLHHTQQLGHDAAY
jgi:hypothetical protein